MTKHCSVCNAENRDEAQFCRACGPSVFAAATGHGTFGDEPSADNICSECGFRNKPGHPLLRELRHEPVRLDRHRAVGRPRAFCPRRRRGLESASDLVRVVRDRRALPAGAGHAIGISAVARRHRAARHPRPRTRGSRSASRRRTTPHRPSSCRRPCRQRRIRPSVSSLPSASPRSSSQRSRHGCFSAARARRRPPPRSWPRSVAPAAIPASLRRSLRRRRRSSSRCRLSRRRQRAQPWSRARRSCLRWCRNLFPGPRPADRCRIPARR